MSSRHKDNAASSSGNNLRSFFLGMGFPLPLIERAIKEKGEDNVDLLLETLFAYSGLKNLKNEVQDSVDCLSSDKNELAAEKSPNKALQKTCSGSSDSMDSLFGDEKDICDCLSAAKDNYPKEESNVLGGANHGKRASLLSMNFSSNEVDFALDKLGSEAPIDELVDFIFATQMDESTKKDGDSAYHNDGESSTERLCGTMDKSQSLLEMGFSGDEVSAAIDKYGSKASINYLADSIVDDQNMGTCLETKKCPSASSSTHYSNTTNQYSSLENFKRRKPKEHIDEMNGLKRPKEEYDDGLVSSIRPVWLEARNGQDVGNSKAPKLQRKLYMKAGLGDGEFEISKLSKPLSCRTLSQMIAKPPYFFLGSVVNLSNDSWVKISQFLYAIEPEFVNTEFSSALSRKEGYIHNLPSQNRLHVSPKSPMTIQEVIPHTKKWWPSWDTRKRLCCISSQISGVSQLCDRFEKLLIGSRGMLSVEQQRDLLHRCRMTNLVWTGHNKLSPMEPEHLEVILGYPLHHTQASGFTLTERLESLEYCFQTDVLCYYISVLKSLFPDGLTLLSIYSGIGGAEISMHRLGIHLKAVVSVEPCEMKRKILKQWWHDSGQSGDLVQIEDIQRLASNKLVDLTKKFGGFDFIICQNPHPPSPKLFNEVGDDGTFASLDFPRFYEFVRVLQRVRAKT